MTQYDLEQIAERFKDSNFIKHVLKEHAYVNVPLNFEEAYALGVAAIAPHIPTIRNSPEFKEFFKEVSNDPEKAKEILFFGKDTLQDAMMARMALTDKQTLSAMCALHTIATYHAKPEKKTIYLHQEVGGHSCPTDAAEQIAGISAAIIEYDTANAENGFLNPNVSCAIDNCGMGGDFYKTANISTLAALIASSANIPICKHGSPANADAGKHGSSDFVAEFILGKESFQDLIGIPKQVVEEAIEEHGFGYTEALDTNYKRVHRLTHNSSFLPHMNDIIGPMTNPLDKRVATKKIIGVNHLIPPEIVAKAFKILNGQGVTDVRRGIFVRGYVQKNNLEGIDELSIMPGGSRLAELREGEVTKRQVFAEEFGIKSVSYKSIAPQGKKGDFSMALLNGEVKGAPLEIVLANAALIFHLNNGITLREGYEEAREVVESGAHREKAAELKEHFR